MSQILIIDPNEGVAAGYAELLQKEGHQVEIAHDGQTGYYQVVKTAPELVLVNLTLPELSGLDLLRGLRPKRRKLGTKFIAIGANDQAAEQRAFRAGADRALMDDPSDRKVLAAVNDMLGSSVANGLEKPPPVPFQTRDLTELASGRGGKRPAEAAPAAATSDSSEEMPAPPEVPAQEPAAQPAQAGPPGDVIPPPPNPDTVTPPPLRMPMPGAQNRDEGSQDPGSSSGSTSVFRATPRLDRLRDSVRKKQPKQPAAGARPSRDDRKAKVTTARMMDAPPRITASFKNSPAIPKRRPKDTSRFDASQLPGTSPKNVGSMGEKAPGMMPPAPPAPSAEPDYMQTPELSRPAAGLRLRKQGQTAEENDAPPLPRPAAAAAPSLLKLDLRQTLADLVPHIEPELPASVEVDIPFPAVSDQIPSGTVELPLGRLKLLLPDDYQGSLDSVGDDEKVVLPYDQIAAQVPAFMQAQAPPAVPASAPAVAAAASSTPGTVPVNIAAGLSALAELEDTAVPESVVATLPTSNLIAQLREGRVVFTVGELKNRLAPQDAALLAGASDETEVVVPLQDVISSVPENVLRPPQEQRETLVPDVTGQGDLFREIQSAAAPSMPKAEDASPPPPPPPAAPARREPVPPPVPPAAPPKSTIRISLREMANQFEIDPEAIDEDARLVIPHQLAREQLPKGRVALPASVLRDYAEGSAKEIMAEMPGDQEIVLPLDQIVAQLPAEFIQPQTPRVTMPIPRVTEEPLFKERQATPEEQAAQAAREQEAAAQAEEAPAEEDSPKPLRVPGSGTTTSDLFSTPELSSVNVRMRENAARAALEEGASEQDTPELPPVPAGPSVVQTPSLPREAPPPPPPAPAPYRPKPPADRLPAAMPPLPPEVQTPVLPPDQPVKPTRPSPARATRDDLLQTARITVPPARRRGQKPGVPSDIEEIRRRTSPVIARPEAVIQERAPAPAPPPPKAEMPPPMSTPSFNQPEAEDRKIKIKLRDILQANPHEGLEEKLTEVPDDFEIVLPQPVVAKAAESQPPSVPTGDLLDFVPDDYQALFIVGFPGDRVALPAQALSGAPSEVLPKPTPRIETGLQTERETVRVEGDAERLQSLLRRRESRRSTTPPFTPLIKPSEAAPLTPNVPRPSESQETQRFRPEEPATAGEQRFLELNLRAILEENYTFVPESIGPEETVSVPARQIQEQLKRGQISLGWREFVSYLAPNVRERVEEMGSKSQISLPMPLVFSVLPADLMSGAMAPPPATPRGLVTPRSLPETFSEGAKTAPIPSAAGSRRTDRIREVAFQTPVPQPTPVPREVPAQDKQETQPVQTPLIPASPSEADKGRKGPSLVERLRGFGKLGKITETRKSTAEEDADPDLAARAEAEETPIARPSIVSPPAPVTPAFSASLTDKLEASSKQETDITDEEPEDALQLPAPQEDELSEEPQELASAATADESVRDGEEEAEGEEEFAAYLPGYGSGSTKRRPTASRSSTDDDDETDDLADDEAAAQQDQPVPIRPRTEPTTILSPKPELRRLVEGAVTSRGLIQGKAHPLTVVMLKDLSSYDWVKGADIPETLKGFFQKEVVTPVMSPALTGEVRAGLTLPPPPPKPPADMPPAMKPMSAPILPPADPEPLEVATEPEQISGEATEIKPGTVPVEEPKGQSDLVADIDALIARNREQLHDAGDEDALAETATDETEGKDKETQETAAPEPEDEIPAIGEVPETAPEEKGDKKPTSDLSPLSPAKADKVPSDKETTIIESRIQTDDETDVFTVSETQFGRKETDRLGELLQRLAAGDDIDDVEGDDLAPVPDQPSVAPDEEEKIEPLQAELRDALREEAPTEDQVETIASREESGKPAVEEPLIPAVTEAAVEPEESVAEPDLAAAATVKPEGTPSLTDVAEPIETALFSGSQLPDQPAAETAAEQVEALTTEEFTLRHGRVLVPLSRLSAVLPPEVRDLLSEEALDVEVALPVENILAAQKAEKSSASGFEKLRQFFTSLLRARVAEMAESTTADQEKGAVEEAAGTEADDEKISRALAGDLSSIEEALRSEDDDHGLTTTVSHEAELPVSEIEEEFSDPGHAELTGDSLSAEQLLAETEAEATAVEDGTEIAPERTGSAEIQEDEEQPAARRPLGTVGLTFATLMENCPVSLARKHFSEVPGTMIVEIPSELVGNQTEGDHFIIRAAQLFSLLPRELVSDTLKEEGDSFSLRIPLVEVVNDLPRQILAQLLEQQLRYRREMESGRVSGIVPASSEVTRKITSSLARTRLPKPPSRPRRLGEDQTK